MMTCDLCGHVAKYRTDLAWYCEYHVPNMEITSLYPRQYFELKEMFVQLSQMYYDLLMGQQTVS